MRRATPIWALLIAALALSASPVTASAQDDPATDANAVYRAALDELYKSKESPGVILLSDSVFRFNGDRSWAAEPVPIDYRASPMKEPFPAGLTYRIPLVVVTRREKDSLARIAASRGDSNPFWIALSERYPAAWGITTFSEVVFSATRERALVFLHHGCGGCFHQETMRLEKVEGRWQIDDRLVKELDSQDGIGPGNLRHLWVDARMRIDSMIADHTRLMQERDSMRLDQRPRRMRGIVINRVTREPTTGASVYMYVATDTTPRLLKFVRPGEFELVDHPIGGVLLVIRCAGSPPNDSALVLAVTSFQIEPAQDSTAVIEAGPFSACWRNRRARPIVAGELASETYRASPFPGAAEAPVYRAVIDELRRTTPGAPVLLRSFPGDPCIHYDYTCGVPELALMVREGVIDSTAVRSLMKAGDVSSPFNSGFAADAGARILTPGEENYIAHETLDVDPERRHQGDSVTHFLQTVQQAHPDSRGITSLSRVAFDEAKSRALVQVRREVPEIMNQVETMVLSRAGSAWKVVQRNVEKEPLSGAYAGSACVPGRAAAMPSDASLESLHGRYALELISATGAGAPRQAMHVVFRIDSTGSSNAVKPSFFQIIDPETGARDENTESAMSMHSGDRELKRLSHMMRLHGEGYLLELREIGGGMIFGSWRFFYGYHFFMDPKRERVPEPAGYFCARKVAEPVSPGPRVASLRDRSQMVPR